MGKVRLAIVLFALLAPLAAVAFTYDESVDGDLSGDRLNPTTLVAEPGSNLLTGTTIAGDLEYVHLSLPPGMQLNALVLNSFVSADNVAFCGVQEGSIFTVSPDVAVESDLLGYSHFGTSGLAGTALPGTDILDNIGQGDGATGFVPPLTGSDYTFWIQQFNAQTVAYQFDFQVVPEPGETASLVAGAGLLAGLRRRRAR
jgi:hypothetical protein